MEKTLELMLDGKKAVVASPEETFEGDYDENVFAEVLENVGNVYTKEYVIERFKEYIDIGFPIWKRMNVKNIKLPVYKYKSYFNDLSKEQLMYILNYDFEGAHRKYVLLSDIFSSKGKFIEINDTQKMILETNSEITNDFIRVTGDAVVIRLIRNDSFSNNTVRFVVENNAKLTLYNLYFSSQNSFGVNNLFIWAKNDAKVFVRDFYSGKGKIASYLGVKLMDTRAKVELKPYFLGSGSSIFDLLYLFRFIGQENVGMLKAEGAMSDSGKVIFRGILDIRRGAKNVEASESERCILLSPDSTMEAIPSLLVDENEIVASHAASSSPLDEDSVFYLMTRGFSKEEAKRYIINGIFESLKEELSEYKLEGLVENALEEFMG
ncbi:MAG: SufD family Fe-S cluster assembly protein [Thermosipho sp. (in: Bacteria)]|nr:SufD family Fe-S cluster assembly protein [Thermosipho sp. (in: thermotogales)]